MTRQEIYERQKELRDILCSLRQKGYEINQQIQENEAELIRLCEDLVND